MTQTTPKQKTPYNPIQNNTFVEDLDGGSFSVEVSPAGGPQEIDDEAGPITISIAAPEAADGVQSAPNAGHEKVVQKNIAPTNSHATVAGYDAEFQHVSDKTREEMTAGRAALARYRVPTVE